MERCKEAVSSEHIPNKQLLIMKKQEFREEIAPNIDELIVNGENLNATILDAEGDPIECSFEGDGCVKLDTKELSFIYLTPENLETLLDLIFESETL